MKKNINELSIPELTEYVQKNFSSLTEEDFLCVIKRINISVYTMYSLDPTSPLFSSPQVLSYELHQDINSYRFFYPSAFNYETLSYLASHITEIPLISPETVAKIPCLLSNTTIAKKYYYSQIYECLKTNSSLTILPFPLPNALIPVNAYKLDAIKNILNIPISDDINCQEMYSYLLDRIINSIVEMRYINARNNSPYSDIISLNNSLLKYLDSEDTRLELALHISQDIGFSMTPSEILNYLAKFASEYHQKGYLDLKLTGEFNNTILNYYRNNFISTEKKKILQDLIPHLSLTAKKERTILNSHRLAIAKKYLKEKDFPKLGITETQFNNYFMSIINEIENQKQVKKTNLHLTTPQIEAIKQVFISGAEITSSKIQSILNNPSISPEILTYIAHKIEQISYFIIRNVTLTPSESIITPTEKEKLGFNYNNFIVARKENVYETICNIILNLDEETADAIINNQALLSDILYLTPYVNLIEELNTETFLKILTYYDKIKPNLLGTTLVDLYDVISLANDFSELSKYVPLILGEDGVAILGPKANQYLNCYITSLKNYKTHIPPLSFDTLTKHYNSGNHNLNRLFIGKMYDDSCIDLDNNAGVKTFQEANYGENGDIVMITDNHNCPLDRILIFRRGNTIQLYSKIGIEISPSVYKHIAEQIMQEAVSCGDNIDYIFLNTSNTKPYENYLRIYDNRFITEFPHADNRETAILLSSSHPVSSSSEIHLNLKAIPQKTYLKSREPITSNPTISEVKRLKALQIIMTSDSVLQHELEVNFASFNTSNYQKFYKGEDWLLAILNDGSYEEIILPTNDPRTISEINTLKDSLNLTKLSK